MSTDSLNPENEITEITFDFEGSHLALCHKTQGFSANNKPQPILIKADDEQITDEAKEALAVIKSGKLPETDSFSEGNPEMKKETQEVESEKVSTPSEKTKTNQGELMSDKTTDQEKALDKAKELEDRLAAMEKAVADSEAEKEQLTAKVESFEKANQERLEKAFIAKVETYSYITEEEREDFAKALIEVDSELIVLALDKAQAAITALTETQGVDGGELNLSKSTKSNRVKEMVMKQHGLTDVSK
ncbi:MAG: hypothetical protein GY804_00255 [Alphaproteobacteria bacterium]|nr:hypothetical protein [Alphaproteobacteria bacterium]